MSINISYINNDKDSLWALSKTIVEQFNSKMPNKRGCQPKLVEGSLPQVQKGFDRAQPDSPNKAFYTAERKWSNKNFQKKLAFYIGFRTFISNF